MKFLNRLIAQHIIHMKFENLFAIELISFSEM